MSTFFVVSDDILGNIISRLPAKSFAAAACVNHVWNRVSDLILSRPRLASGLSVAESPEIAVDEALEMALSKPIRPHFAIAFVGLQFPIEEMHNRITSKIGANTLLITSAALGIIGVDSTTNELEEVNWEYEGDAPNTGDDMYRGITLVIGFVPGLKLNVFPMLRTKSEPQVTMVDKFISDVRDFTASVSGDANRDPIGITLFGDHCRNVKPILAEIDTKISRETIMIGDVHNFFVCTNAAILNVDTNLYTLDAVALVFARDNQNNEVEIKFHVGISSGIIPIGPKLEILDVLEYEDKSSWLIARTQDEQLPLDASNLLTSLHALIEDNCYFLYVGVIKEIVPQEGGPSIKYTSFHEVVGTRQNMFIVAGTGINPGDACMFYHSDMETAKGSSTNVYNRFNSLAEPPPRQVLGQLISANQANREKVFGGILFGSSNRGEKYFGNSMTDCMPFLKNFPQVPFGGTFCFEPIGRSPVLEDEEWPSQENRFNMQAFNTVHLLMSYKTS
ncbi:F-box/LRR-repeat protein At5g63520 [Eutrema salsugineum]|uniref:F-box/LRR-repeat protein At5g63520 n=1 Tax=Eutrema salsugineum TaxID=72664 RepID=UPI000CED15EE|nr:F-box/LRR-repeat protein At5g63520 [Eutrema salsugineum]